MVWDLRFCSLIGLFSSVFLQCSMAQRVKVQPEVETYPGQSVALRCQFPNPGETELTQVSWIYERGTVRTNIAVFNPNFGVNYPQSPVSGRVSFMANPPPLANPTIQITNIQMADEGKYICEYATYPSGNEQGVTSLILLAKPNNSANTITVSAGPTPVAVARCESANGRPPATISWVTAVGGNASSPTTTQNSDNTVTVRSEYWMVPRPADNGKDISCVVTHRTLPTPSSFPSKLVIEYPPQVKIVGYDDNWYLGRTNAVLVCQADANPIATTVTWRTMSGLMPDTVQVKENKLTVLKVDETVNATFICEVRNRLGTGKDQVATAVRETQLPQTGSVTASVIGAIIGVLLLLVIIGTVVVLVRKQRQRKADGPPTYKPPPPAKPSMTTDRHPLVYYETQKAEPITDLDSYHGEEDVDNPRPFENSALPGWEVEEPLPPYSDHQDIAARASSNMAVSRGDSFVSPAVIV
ncbi:LOW QUALITY PROTEIN: nectin-2 [Brachyhypopomus gauderio]|uniref:LOW QUALITY PROTEIN: nectin-2 n=1 Tax=Brachyhypopomus gauderio TaxID=698409 RepID=UPI0040421234